MSLRARLVAALAVLAGTGMLVFAFVAHTALRSYLEDRVDQQVQAAVIPVTQALIQKARKEGADAFKLPPRAGLRDRGEVPDTFQLPSGTYGELRAAGGKLTARTTFSYRSEDLPKPDLNSAARVDEASGVYSVGSLSGSTKFRVANLDLPAGLGNVTVAVPLTELEETLDRLAEIEAIAGIAVLTLLIVVGWWVIRLGLHPLREMERTAEAIAAGDLSRRVETEDDRTEVGRLGLALNEMLRQIETAFEERKQSEDRLRRFVADASHELRTPLSSIKGYSELFRLGAAASPAELEKAMTRIEGESERMGGLVEDLLVLARLDQAPETRRAPVGLRTLAEEACADARAAAPGREVTLTAGEEITVEADSDQLRQVLANLLSNALRYSTAPGAVEVGVGQVNRDAVITVRDHGPGIQPEDAERVFERFWRPSASRRREDGGSGLGLAIVRAVVESHGGEVGVAKAPGGGALFEVRMPLAAQSLTGPRTRPERTPG